MNSETRMKKVKENMQDQPDERLYIKSIEKGFRILRAFYGQSRELSLTEIVQLAGLGQSATQRFLYTLRSMGYIQQDPRTKRYQLTSRVLDFGFAYLHNNWLLEAASPYLLEASKQSDETVNLTEPDRTDIVYIARFPSRRIISANVVLGERLPMFSTAPGRAMLASLPEADAQEILKRSQMRSLTPYTCTDSEVIKQKLPQIRKDGYAISDQETYIGDTSIAAPIYNGESRVVAAVNISVASVRWKKARVEQELAPTVLETARAISKALGYMGRN